MQGKSLSRASVGTTKLIMLLSAFVAMLNETSVTVALSDLMGIFGIGVSTVQWLVTGFMLVTAVIVPITAYIIQRFRDRSIYFASIALLLAGCIVCGLAPSFGWLLAGRLVQAAGTCCVWALTMNILLSLSTDENRGGELGLIALVSIFAPAIAPSIAGIVLQSFGWRWLFLGIAPLFAALGILAYAKLDDTTETSGNRPFDLTSAALVALAFGGLIFGATGIGDSGRTAETAIAIALGAVALALLVLRQLRLTEPLLDMRLFGGPAFSRGMAAVFFCNLTMMGAIVLMPMLYVRGLGMSAAQAGLCVMPACLLNGLTSPLIGKLCDRIGPGIPAKAGAVAMAAGALALAFIPSSAPVALYIAIHCFILIAITSGQTASQAKGMSGVAPRSIPHGTAIMSTLIQLGGGFGSAIYAAIFASSGAAAGPARSAPAFAGFHRAFLVGAAILVIPLLLSFLPERAAAGSSALERAEAGE
jgi:Arabinose efflux permease